MSDRKPSGERKSYVSRKGDSSSEKRTASKETVIGKSKLLKPKTIASEFSAPAL